MTKPTFEPDGSRWPLIPPIQSAFGLKQASTLADDLRAATPQIRNLHLPISGGESIEPIPLEQEQFTLLHVEKHQPVEEFTHAIKNGAKRRGCRHAALSYGLRAERPPAPNRPAQAQPVVPKKHSGEWRSSKLVGLNVYNMQNEKVDESTKFFFGRLVRSPGL